MRNDAPRSKFRWQGLQLIRPLAATVWLAAANLTAVLDRRSPRRNAALLLLTAVCAGLSALSPAAHAQFTCSWNDATANWTTAADWSSCNGVFPNNGGGNTYDVTIPQGLPVLTSTVAVGSVTINNPGGLELEDANLTTSGGLTVNGSLGVDVSTPGGSRLNITGTLTNTGTVIIGNAPSLASQATTVTAAGLANAGTIFIGTAPAQSSLEIAAPAPSTWTGSAFLSGDALLQFGGTNQIGTIGNNAQINLTGPQAFVASAGLGTTSNSALTSMTTIASGGSLQLNNGASLTTSGGVTVNGSVGVDAENEMSGGSSLDITGTLINHGTVGIGNAFLTTPANLTAGGLVNTGNVLVQSTTHHNPSGTANLTVNGPVSNSGSVELASFNFGGPPATLKVIGSGNTYSQTGGGTDVLQNTQLIAPIVNIVGGVLSLGSVGIQAATPATVVGNVNLSGGIMMGLGIVAGNLTITNSGTIMPFDLANNTTPATLTVNGNYAQSGGTFNEMLHGTGVQIDEVQIGSGGTVDLTGGDLTVSGVTFALGQMFDDIMTFQPGELTGTFATINGGGDGTILDLGNGLALEAIYDNAGGDISLEVISATSVPEPGSMGLLGFGLGMLFLITCRQRRRG